MAKSYWARGESAAMVKKNQASMDATADANMRMQASREQEISRRDYVAALKDAHRKGDEYEIKELTRRRKATRDKGR